MIPLLLIIEYVIKEFNYDSLLLIIEYVIKEFNYDSLFIVTLIRTYFELFISR